MSLCAQHLTWLKFELSYESRGVVRGQYVLVNINVELNYVIWSGLLGV